MILDIQLFLYTTAHEHISVPVRYCVFDVRSRYPNDLLHLKFIVNGRSLFRESCFPKPALCNKVFFLMSGVELFSKLHE